MRKVPKLQAEGITRWMALGAGVVLCLFKHKDREKANVPRAGKGGVRGVESGS